MTTIPGVTMDTNAIAVTLSSGLIIALVMQFFKNVLEIWVKPTDAIHDSAVRILSAVVGAVGFLGHAALTMTAITGPLAWDSIAQGAFAGLTAIGSYHVLGGAPTLAVARRTVASHELDQQFHGTTEIHQLLPATTDANNAQ